jgi:hypothetical protein
MSRFTTRTTELSFVLRPSRIQGVGVFTTHAIASGTHLAMFSRSESARFRRVTGNNRYLVKKYGIPFGKNRYFCPGDFRSEPFCNRIQGAQ